MVSGLFARRDPWWEDGQGARRVRTRQRIVGMMAFAMAIGACGITTAAWWDPSDRWLTRATGPCARSRPMRSQLSPSSESTGWCWRRAAIAATWPTGLTCRIRPAHRASSSSRGTPDHPGPPPHIHRARRSTSRGTVRFTRDSQSPYLSRAASATYGLSARRRPSRWARRLLPRDGHAHGRRGYRARSDDRCPYSIEPAVCRRRRSP